eukprot:GHVT01077400.1.p2 GENE.GHVT01077400.1~~GHVT01077400.1.p2  ORF type:complete len:190 (-),score=50.76 GHVT01077400.1:676-1245(-)
MLSILSSVRRSGGGQPAGLSCLLWKLRKIAGDLPPRAVGLACRELGLLGIRDVPLFEELAKRSQQLADALDMVAAVHVAQGFAAVGVQCESLMAALAPLLLAAASRAGGSCGLPAEAAEEREAVGSSTGSSPSSAVETEEEATDVYPKVLRAILEFAGSSGNASTVALGTQMAKRMACGQEAERALGGG